MKIFNQRERMPKRKDSRAPELVENRKECKVLIIGSPTDLSGIGPGLESFGYKVEGSVFVPKKIEEIQNYNAIIMHASYEDMEGLLQEIERTPDCDHIKVLVITGAGRGHLQDIKGLNRIDDTSYKDEPPADFIERLDNLLGIIKH